MDWPSETVPTIGDDVLGIHGDAFRVERDMLSKHLGNVGKLDPAGSVARGETQGATAAPSEESMEVLDVTFGGDGFDPAGYGPLQTGQPEAASDREPVNKPSLCLVMGDALGADLLRWCTTVCRSRQWRELFSVKRAVQHQQEEDEQRGKDANTRTSAPQPAVTDLAGTKRSAQHMEVAYCTDPDTEYGSPQRPQKKGLLPPPTPSNDAMEEEEDGTRQNEGGISREDLSKVREKGREPPGLAQILCIVSQVVHAVKEHTKVLGAARDRAGAVTLVGELGGRILEGGTERSFDLRKRETSAAVQAVVGALADAVLDAFADHMADPALHHHLRLSNSTQQSNERRDTCTNEEHAKTGGGATSALTGGAAAPATPERGTAMVLAEISPLVDGSSPAETVGLSVDLVSDIAWLFSSLEPEADKGVGGGAARAGPAAAMLSSAISCWASGRILACMPGRAQLEYALGLQQLSDGDADAGIAGQSHVQSSVPSVRPLPARLACFAVRTLLENAQDARDKGPGTPDATAPSPPSLPRARPSPRPAGDFSEESAGVGGSTTVKDCNGRPTAFYRVALIAEQMPAWRQRLQQQSGTAAQGQDGDDGGDDAAVATAALAAAAEVLDALAAVMCAAAEHERLSTIKVEKAEASGAQRRPTRGNASTVGHVIGPALQAMSVLLRGDGGAGSLRGNGVQAGSNVASLRLSMLARVKKRRSSSSDSHSSSATTQGMHSATANVTWRALAGLQLPASLNRVHVSALLLAWEPWHPWVEKGCSTWGTSSGGGLMVRTTSIPFRQSRSWQTFGTLTDELAQACVAARSAPLQGKGLAALVARTVVSFRATSAGDGPLPFLDMPAVLILCKVGLFFILSGWLDYSFVARASGAATRWPLNPALERPGCLHTVLKPRFS